MADIEDDAVWQRDLAAIAEMRKKFVSGNFGETQRIGVSQDAAVDTMGCHMLHDRDAPPEVQDGIHEIHAER